MTYTPDNNDKSTFEADGFVIVEQLISTDKLPRLHRAFDDLFNGTFETGVHPDEVNWQYGQSDPTLTRQICNGWKANRDIARVVLDETLAKAIATFSGWSGVRIMIDNVIWKPAATKSLGFHQDNAFLSWFDPGEILTCWIALDDTTKTGGTVEYARASHRWGLAAPTGEFHAPEDYRLPVSQAAKSVGRDLDIHYVEVKAGGGTFHHGATWHGSGANLSSNPRRSLVLHAMPADVQYIPENFSQGIGPIYSRYKRLHDNTLDENYFPILWRADGYRTPELQNYLA